MPSEPRPAPSTTLVTDADGLAAALRGLEEPVLGLDVERSDAQSYFRRAALVQVGAAGRCVLADAVALADLGALHRHLAGRLAVLHAAENDVAPLAAACVEPEEIADTGVAASLLGLPTGLDPLLRELLGVELPGDKERLQRADWEARPLSGELIAYAAADVVHLPDLWAELAARLEAAGRRTWYDQELEAALASARADTRDWQRTSGAGRLDPAGRARLRALWEEREALAREHDLAPQYLLHDETLVDLAASPPQTVREVVDRARRTHPVTEHAGRLHAALARGSQAPPEEPPPAVRWDDDRAAALTALRRARAEVARSLDLDPGVLCPSRRLAAAVGADPDDPEELCERAGLRPWQRELLRDVLWEAWTRAR